MCNISNGDNDAILINESPVFCPGKTILKKFLYTNSDKLSSGFVERPGLFSTTKYQQHLFFIILIILLEFIATYLAIDEGYQGFVVFIFIILDFIIAIAAHYLSHKNLTLELNYKFVLDRLTNDPIRIAQERNKLNKSIGRKRTIKYIGHTLLLLSAIGKVYFCLRDTFYGEITPVFIAITVFYFLAAFLHMNATGNFIAASIFYSQFNSAKNNFKDKVGGKYAVSAPTIHEFQTEANISVNNDENLHIRIENNGNDSYLFRCFTYLSDNDLGNLIERQGDNQRAATIVAKEGVKCQLRMIDSIPALNVNE